MLRDIVVEYAIYIWQGDGDPDLTDLNNEIRSETEEYRREAIAILTSETYTNLRRVPAPRGGTRREARVYRLEWSDTDGFTPVLVSRTNPDKLSWIKKPKRPKGL